MDAIASASSASWYHSGTPKLSCKQCLCIYKAPCLARACWAQPKPVVLRRADAGFAFLQNALSALCKSAQPSRFRDVHRDWDCIPTSRIRTANLQCHACLSLCIAHSYYQSGERIYVNECEDSIVITNPGSFLPQTVEAVLQPTYNPPFYRNQLLADAMVKFHMIDTATSGIKKVYRIQKEKFFPLPDYNLSNVNQVAVTVYGKILDEKYTQLLYKNNESLDLETVFLLDKIQKHVQITKEQAVRLKKRGLVEGRYPNIYVSFKVASMVGKKAEYVHNKGLDENICRQLILEALKNAPTTQHELLEVLDVGALPGHLSTEQKSRKLSNILQKMKKEGLVKPTGSRRYAVWSLV